MALNLHYEKVLKDLEDKRTALFQESARIRKDIDELDRLLNGIRRMAPEEQIEVQRSFELNTENERELPNLTKMSMRWGILCLLVDYAIAPMSSMEIADLLEKGGLPDPSGKLRKNVSAVLSRMVGLQEADNTGNSYVATNFARDMWASIKKSPKYLTLQGNGELTEGD